MPLLLAALLPLLSPLNAAPPGALQDKPVGVLLLGEGGSPEWDRTVADLRRVFSDRTPFEFAALADGRDMQRGIDALARQRVKTIVLVPLAIFAFGEEMDETRYLLGISKRPPAGDAAQPLAQARLNSPCPLVLARPLEADPIFVDLLASRAKPLSREPSGEALLLVGQAPERLDARARWLASASDLAEKVRQRAGLAGAGAYALRSA
ncbi:MAG: hypothetical protein KGK30_04775, partial [Elusimicrobia bacterium]|nr:hypothetical protein [Elusimicrobiota bacterium]